ncbi:MAG: DUF5723 family protein [Bacteroidales bacterium]
MQYVKIIIISLFFSLLIPAKSSAQVDMTTHYINIVPQSNYENPALIPDLQYHFSIPGLSSIYAEAGNSGFHFQNVIENKGDSSYLKLDDLVNKHLKKNNHVSLHYAQELLSVGFQAHKNMYFNFSVAERADFRFTYPRMLVELPYHGNGEYVGETVEISPLAVKATHLREYAIGMSWQEPDHWSVGARAKLLFAKANAWTEKADVKLYTHEEGYDLETEVEFLGHLSLYQGFDMDNPDKNSDFKPGDYLMNTANWGGAIDLGGNYFINDDFSVNASIVDLGIVNFDRYNYNYQIDKESVTFEGIDAYKHKNKTDSEIEQEIQNTLDSIADKFNLQEDQGSYRMPLTTRFYLGGQYHLSDNQRVGALFRGQFFNGAFWPAFTASYNHRFGRVLSLSGSYSIAHNSYLNLGLGAAVNLGPVQFYLSSDNWLAGLMPERTKFLNLRFGLNIAVRHPKAQRPMFEMH